jgi:hypothetical protein
MHSTASHNVQTQQQRYAGWLKQGWSFTVGNIPRLGDTFGFIQERMMMRNWGAHHRTVMGKSQCDNSNCGMGLAWDLGVSHNMYVVENAQQHYQKKA